MRVYYCCCVLFVCLFISVKCYNMLAHTHIIELVVFVAFVAGLKNNLVARVALFIFFYFLCAKNFSHLL